MLPYAVAGYTVCVSDVSLPSLRTRHNFSSLPFDVKSCSSTDSLPWLRRTQASVEENVSVFQSPLGHADCASLFSLGMRARITVSASCAYRLHFWSLIIYSAFGKSVCLQGVQKGGATLAGPQVP